MSNDNIDPSTFMCGFCDDHAIGLVPGPFGPWAFCGNHKSAARAEARVDARLVAHGRSEDEACQAGTPGCAIDHVTDTPCGTW
jgi:hypothetical protein